MPIYEYQCTACGHLHEALQKISDSPLVDCPACGQAKLKKKVTAAAFRLKGGGWYETDFKSGNKKNLAGDAAAPGKDGGDGGKGDAGKTDAGKSDAGKSGTSSGDGISKTSNSTAGKKGGDSSAA